MNHARVGVYTLKSPTTPTEVTQLATEMLPIFKRQPGFIDYEIVVTGDKAFSFSTWMTKEQANEGTRQAATFVKERALSGLTLDHSYVGDVTLSSRA